VGSAKQAFPVKSDPISFPLPGPPPGRMGKLKQNCQKRFKLEESICSLAQPVRARLAEHSFSEQQWVEPEHFGGTNIFLL
jgi:hypothetical protein